LSNSAAGALRRCRRLATEPDRGLYGIRNQVPLATAQVGSYPIGRPGDSAGEEGQAYLPVWIVHVHVDKRDRLPGAEREPPAEYGDRRVRRDESRHYVRPPVPA